MNKMDVVVISLYIVFGVLILSGYGYMVYKGDYENLWTNDNQNMFTKGYGTMYYIYLLMIFLSMISGAYLVYYLTTNQDLNKALVYTGSVFLLVFSMIWAFKPLWKINKFTLGLVAIGALCILIAVSMNYTQGDIQNSLAITAATILFTQLSF